MRLDEIEREFKEAESTLAQADQTLVAGRLNDAHKLYEQALALLTSAFGAEDGRTISCMESLGDACYELKKYDEAARRYKEVFAVRQRLGGMRDQEEAVALFKIAKAYSHAPNAREAEKHFEMAADIARKKLLPGDPVLSNILEASASYAARLKQKDKAEALREEARQNRARFGSSSQVIERYLEPLAGPRLGEQTLPPGANLRFRKEPQPDEAKEPPTEERKQINQAVALLAAVTVLFVAVFGSLYSLRLFKGDDKEKEKQTIITPPPIAPPLPSASREAAPVRVQKAARKERRQKLRSVAKKQQQSEPHAVKPSADRWNLLKQERKFD